MPRIDAKREADFLVEKQPHSVAVFHPPQDVLTQAALQPSIRQVRSGGRGAF